MANLKFRKGQYEIRISIPPQLRPALGGKSEFKERLGTDRIEAAKTAPHVLSRFASEIQQARETIAADRLSIEQIAKLHYERELAADDDARRNVGSETVAGMPPIFRAQRLVLLRMIRDGRARADEAEAVIGYAVDTLVGEGIIPHPPSPAERPVLLRALAGVQIDAIARFEERDRGQAKAGAPESEHLKPKEIEAETAAPPIRQRGRGGKTLKECLDLFHAERNGGTRRTLAQGTVRDQEVAIRMFGEVVGSERGVRSLTRLDAATFKAALLATPNRYTMRFPGLTLPEAIAANKQRSAPIPTIDTATINDKYLSHLKALLSWCVREGHVDANVADGVKVDEGKGYREPSRVPFTPDDLRRIFSKPLFDDPQDYGSRHWALLIALYTGARSASEIRRIKLSDIYEEQGILVFDLAEASKNVQSKRLIPVHRRLIELGLPAYVEKLKGEHRKALFFDWEPEDKINRWFLRTYRAEVGIADDRKVFHSFRHTWKTALARTGVPHDVREMLAGHKDQSAGAVYIADPSRTMLQTMRDELDRVSFNILGK